MKILIRINKNEMDINERRDFTDLFKKLDEITQLSKNIDPSTKLAGINSAYSIDLNRLRKTGTYERFDYEDDMFDLNKNKNYNKNLEKNSVELPSVNERISFQNSQLMGKFILLLIKNLILYISIYIYLIF